MKISYVGNSVLLCMTLLTACAPAPKEKEEREETKKIAVSHNSGENIIYLDQQLAGYSSDQAALDALLAKHSLVVVDFFAEWCGPCRSLGEVIERIAGKHVDVVFLKVNIDKHNTIGTNHKVRAMPTLKFFKNGQVVHTKVGAPSASELSNLIQTHLK